MLFDNTSFFKRKKKGGGGMLSDFVSFQIFIFISLSFAPWASMKFMTAIAFS
jgi:hypothetical protein